VTGLSGRSNGGEGTGERQWRLEQVDQVVARWKQAGMSDVGHDGPDLFGTQISDELSLGTVKCKPATGRNPVVLHAEPDGGENVQVDVLDVGKLDVTHFLLPW